MVRSFTFILCSIFRGGVSVPDKPGCVLVLARLHRFFCVKPFFPGVCNFPWSTHRTLCQASVMRCCIQFCVLSNGYMCFMFLLFAVLYTRTHIYTYIYVFVLDPGALPLLSSLPVRVCAGVGEHVRVLCLPSLFLFVCWTLSCAGVFARCLYVFRVSVFFLWCVCVRSLCVPYL